MITFQYSLQFSKLKYLSVFARSQQAVFCYFYSELGPVCWKCSLKRNFFSPEHFSSENKKAEFWREAAEMAYWDLANKGNISWVGKWKGKNAKFIRNLFFINRIILLHLYCSAKSNWKICFLFEQYIHVWCLPWRGQWWYYTVKFSWNKYWRVPISKLPIHSVHYLS